MSENPTPAPALVRRVDAWESVLTGLGDASRDKRLSAKARARPLSFEECRELYRGDDIAQRIVDMVADELVREWAEVKVEDDADAGEALDAKLEELDARGKFRDALRFRRAYGGSLILVGANDGADLKGLAEPLDESRIAAVEYLTVFDCREAQALYYHDNPLAPHYGEPRLYRIHPRALGAAGLGLVDVHASRVLRFTEPVSSRDDLAYAFGWGDSILSRMHEVLRDFGLAWSSAGALLQDFAQAVYSIKGLAEAVAADRADLILQRIKIMDLSRSLLRGVVLDDDENFERKPTPIAGLPDLLDRFCNRLAAAADVPVTRLMGQSPAGLNATGASDVRNFYDQIRAKQNSDVRPQLERLVKLIMLSKAGPTRAKEPEVWSVKFAPLWQLDDVQRAQVRASLATADGVYLDRGVVSPDEVASSRFGGDEFGLDLQLDSDGRERFGAVEPDPTDPAAADLRPKFGEGEAPAGTDPAPKAAPAAPAKPAATPAPTAPPASGGAPAVTGAAPAPGAESVQDTALNGAQVTSMIEIVQAVAAGELPRDSGLAMLQIAFRLRPEDAERIMGTVGNGFQPTKPEPPPAPFGAGNAPPPPSAKGDKPEPPPADDKGKGK
jgi:phage-related protein (TIGR01555 family)